MSSLCACTSRWMFHETDVVDDVGVCACAKSQGFRETSEKGLVEQSNVDKAKTLH